jgi:hypothetical protein
VCSNLVSSNKLDGNGVITMPGSIFVSNSGTFENKENTGSQMGTPTKKNILRKEDSSIPRGGAWGLKQPPLSA